MTCQGQRSLCRKKTVPTENSLLDLSREPVSHSPSEPSHSHMPGIVKTVAMLGARAPSQKMTLKPWHTGQFVYLTHV